MPGYSPIVMEHFSSPHNQGALEDADVVGVAHLPGRPAQTRLYLHVEGQRIDAATFETFGCGASIAACSVLTDMVRDQSLARCREIDRQRLLDELGGLPGNKEYCASLAVLALDDALQQLGKGS